MNPLICRFRTPIVSDEGARALLERARSMVSPDIIGLLSEYCYYIQTTDTLSTDQEEVLTWLLAETFEPDRFSKESFLKEKGVVIEVGPRMNFTTAWSTNAVSICHASGLFSISRIERARRYLLQSTVNLESEKLSSFANTLHDRMTECVYPDRLSSFVTGVTPEPVYSVPVIEEGRSALEKINISMGLGLDEWDIDYYYNLFTKEIGRNPTNVECFDLSQSNSEHSRHWFFKGRLVIDGKEVPENLLSLIQRTLQRNPGNSVIAFKDNSSAIQGYDVTSVTPERPGVISPFMMSVRKQHIIFTAETHNFPSGVAPFPGAETGTGGRIRDVQATGRGAHVIAGTAAYCVGNLRIPGYDLPWEDGSFAYPTNLASPLSIEVEASNGASDYGNKFGEPVIQGYTRSFGLRLPGGERREWLKPIMFTGGVGQLDGRHVDKNEPTIGMHVTKVGGPAYRIGMGGGSASSMIQGQNIEDQCGPERRCRDGAEDEQDHPCLC